MTDRGPERPTLNYEPRGRHRSFTMTRRQVLFIAAIITLQLAYPAFQWGRTWWLRRAERQFNTRVVPLVKSDPRFAWVYVGGEAGYVRGYISPSGVVQTPADLAALRSVLQGAQPPMPLDLQFITVTNPMAATGPTTERRPSAIPK